MGSSRCCPRGVTCTVRLYPNRPAPLPSQKFRYRCAAPAYFPAHYIRTVYTCRKVKVGESAAAKPAPAKAIVKAAPPPPPKPVAKPAPVPFKKAATKDDSDSDDEEEQGGFFGLFGTM